MANFFYFDANGAKQGPVSSAQLKDLANQGIITPETQLETDGGHRGTANQINGLFPPPAENPFVNPPQPYAQPPYQQPVPVPKPMIYCSACGNQVLASAFVCPKCGTKIAKSQPDPQPFQVLLSPTEQTIKQLKLYFLLFCISFAACVPMVFIGFMLDGGYANDPGLIGMSYDKYVELQMTARPASAFFAMVGLCGTIAVIVFSILLYHKCRQQIPEIQLEAQTKSFWQRVKDAGLGRKVNKALELLGLQGTVNETLGIVVRGLLMVEVMIFVQKIKMTDNISADARFGLTMLDTVAFISLMITSIIYLNGLKNAVITLLQNRSQSAAPPRFE